LDGVEKLVSRPEERVTDALPLGKDQQLRRRGVIEADAEDDQAAGLEFCGKVGELGQLFEGGGAPGGPKIEEEKFSAEGGGVVRLAGDQVLKGDAVGELEGLGGGSAGGEGEQRPQQKGEESWHGSC
jgi:hypothetical protein